MTQTEAILSHLKTYGSITPLEALREYGCMRLGARIWDLKREGADIVTRLETRRTEAGEYKRFARYELREEAS